MMMRKSKWEMEFRKFMKRKLKKRKLMKRKNALDPSASARTIEKRTRTGTNVKKSYADNEIDEEDEGFDLNEPTLDTTDHIQEENVGAVKENTPTSEEDCSVAGSEFADDSSEKNSPQKPHPLRESSEVDVQPEEPKIKKRGVKFSEEECLMCHQCQRNDKGVVVRCTCCKRKRFCIPCINNWYPQLKCEDIAKKCPVCRGNCNCKACLQSDKLIKEMQYANRDTIGNNCERVELLKYLLQGLLPFLRQLDKEQMIEKELEAKKQGIISLKESQSRLLIYGSVLLRNK